MKTSAPNRPSLKSRFLSGGLWALLGKIISSASTLGVNILLARLLSAEDMGSFFLIFSIVSTFSIIAQWGLGRGLVKLVASELAKENIGTVRADISSSFIIVVLISVLLALLMISPVGDWFVRKLSGTDFLVPVTGLIGLWIIIRALQGIISESFRGFHDIKKATIFGGMLTAVISLLLYFSVWLQTESVELEAAVKLMVHAATISLIIGGVLLTKKVGRFVLSRKSEISKVYSFGLPLMITNLSLFATLEFHIWVLAYFQPETEVALYGASLRLVLLLALPLTIINSVIPPMIADMYSQKQFSRVQGLLQKSATIVSLPAIIIFIVIIFYGSEVLGLVYGDNYTQAYIPLIVLALGQLINVFTGSPGILLTMSGHERVVMKTAFLAGSIGIITSLIGVQNYGAVGAATGYTVGIIINNISMWLYSTRYLTIHTHSNLSSLKEIFRRLRRDIELHDVNGGPLAFLGKLVSKIELFWWNLRGHEVVECYGDSHVKVFRGLNHQKWVGKRRFRTVSVKGATAYGIGNPNSSTNAFHIFTSRLNDVPKGRDIIFMMGEVDVGFLVWLRAEKTGSAVVKCMEEAFQRYTSFLSDVKADHPNIKICSVPLPTISDDDAHGDIANARSEVNVTQKERTELTLKFNSMLKVWSRENEFEYFDFDLLALDVETNLVKESLLNKNTSDHHYGDEEFFCLIRKVLSF